MPEDIAFSRSGNSDAAKLISRLDVPVTEDFRFLIANIATKNNLTTAEFSRMTLERAVRGDVFIARRVLRLPCAEQSDESPTHTQQELDSMVAALAAITGKTVDQYKQSIIERAMFGDLFVALSGSQTFPFFHKESGQ